ncbi:MAG TPA: 50S ribosomal protein L32 [Dehalococcoidia bacterium]|nr:50S ribosomal protein L32 [Dehalococcoidia bacterium]
MPPLPKRKYPKSRQGKRRSHLRLTVAQLNECPRCHSPRLPHHACPTCGFYKHRQALLVESPKLSSE